MIFFDLSLLGSTKQDIYNAYINNKMPAWKTIIDQLENKPDQRNELLLELVNYQYGYIAWCLGENRKDEARNYLSKAEDNLKILETRKFAISKTFGYKSAFYGFHIGLNIFLSPFIGPKSSNAAKQAISVDPDDFFGFIQMGNVLFYAPSLVGGSKPEALKSYLKAMVLMEKSNIDNKEDWNYLSLLTSVAKAYEVLDDYANAKLIYEKILKFEPQYKWVSDELYPKLLKKLK